MARNRTIATADEGLAVVTPNTDADVEAILAAMDGGADVEVELDPTEPTDNDAEVEAALAEISIEAARNDAYVEQESDTDIRSEEEIIEDAAADEASGARKRVKAVRAPRVAGPDVQDDLLPWLKTFTASNPLVLDAEEGELDEGAVEAFAKSITQRKIRSKIANLLAHVNQGRKVKVFNEIAMSVFAKALLAEETVTKKQLFDAYKAKGYNDGTAASVSGQMMSMAPALKIATKPSAGVLQMNPNSTLLDFYASK